MSGGNYKLQNVEVGIGGWCGVIHRPSSVNELLRVPHSEGGATHYETFIDGHVYDVHLHHLRI